VFFIGSNMATLDTVVSTSFPAIFFGTVWTDYLTDLPDSQSVCLVMGSGINVKPHPIVMASSTGCSEDYRAAFTSFNSDGFTLNVTNAASADRPISWMAYGGYTIAGGSADLIVGNTYNLGQKILSAFAMNYRTSGQVRDGCEDGQYTSLYIGAASYPSADNPPFYTTRSWGSGGTSRFSITGTQGFTRGDWNINPSPAFASAINIDTGDFPPIVLEDRLQLYRALVETSITTGGSGGPLRWFAQWLDGENWNNSFNPSATISGVQLFTSGNAFLNEIQGAIYTGILGPEVQGLSAEARMAIGFITKDGQGCVGANQSGHAFQSTQYGCVAQCDGSGALAAEGVIDEDTITWTTEVATGSSSYEGGIMAWGPPAGGWLPQIYRRWPY
jgi:hypothetical protein